LSQLAPEVKEKIMGWLTQPFYEKGKAEGKAEATTEGEAKALIRVLESRFGRVCPILSGSALLLPL
jgi:hypothetical protein